MSDVFSYCTVIVRVSLLIWSCCLLSLLHCGNVTCLPLKTRQALEEGPLTTTRDSAQLLRLPPSWASNPSTHTQHAHKANLIHARTFQHPHNNTAVVLTHSNPTSTWTPFRPDHISRMPLRLAMGSKPRSPRTGDPADGPSSVSTLETRHRYFCSTHSRSHASGISVSPRGVSGNVAGLRPSAIHANPLLKRGATQSLSWAF